MFFKNFIFLCFPFDVLSKIKYKSIGHSTYYLHLTTPYKGA